MKFFRSKRCLIFTALFLEASAQDYTFNPNLYIPAVGANWTYSTTWSPQGVPDTTSNCSVQQQDADGNYLFIINAPNCQARSFQVPSAVSNIDLQVSDGIESGYSSNILQLNPSGSDGLYFNNTPDPTSLGSDVQFVHSNLQFITDGNIHNDLNGFLDDYNQYISSSLEFDDYSCIYGNNINLSIINELNTQTALFRNSILGSDSNGANILSSLNLSGVNGTFIADTSCVVGNKVSLITNSTNISLIQSQLAVNSGTFNLQSGNILIDSQSYFGPCVMNMNGGFISNNNLMSFGSFVSGSYVPSNSSLAVGTITGPGSLYFAGNATVSVPITLSSINIGSGLNPTTMNSFSNGFSAITLNNTSLSGSISINSFGTLTGIGFVNGSVNSQGSITSPQIVIGATGSLLSVLAFSNFPIVQSAAVFGNNSTITMTSGAFSQSNVSTFGSGGSVFSMTGGAITSDNTSFIGPISMNLTGGQITQAGALIAGQYSGGTFIAGSSTLGNTITGNGNVYIAQNAQIPGNLSVSNLLIGQGLDPSHNLQNVVVTATITGQSTGNLLVGTGSSLFGDGIINGNVNNFGNINPQNLKIGQGGSTSFLDLNSALITSTNGVIGSASNSIYVYSGTLSETNSSTFAFNAGGLYMTGGAILSDATSLIGPCIMNLQGGQIINSGTLSIGALVGGTIAASNSYLTGAAISGSGSLLLTGTLNTSSQTSIFQGSVYIGSGATSLSTQANAPANMVLSGGSITANVVNGTFGVLSGGGIVLGTITNYGLIESQYIHIGSNNVSSNVLELNSPGILNNYGICGSVGNSIYVDTGTIICQPNSVFAENAALLAFGGGSLTANSAEIGNGASQIQFSNATLNLTNSSSFGSEAGLLSLSSGTINADVTSTVGPMPVNISGGNMNLAGIFTIGKLDPVNGYLPSNSTITGGVINSAGSLLVAGNLTVANSFTSDDMIVGCGVFPSAPTGSISATATLNVLGNLTSNVLNLVSGSITGNGGIIIGTLTNQGNINPKSLVIGSSSSTNGALTLQANPLINELQGTIGWGSNTISIVGGSTTSNNNTFFGGGNLAQVISISGGSFYNGGAGNFAQNGGLISMSGGFVSNDNTSFIGPVCLNQNSGNILNAGTITLGTSRILGSNLIGGSVTGNGVILVTGTAVFNMPITQNNVFIGTPSNSGNLVLNDNLYADLTVYPAGFLQGDGAAFGDTDVFGTLSPGANVGQIGSIDFFGNLNLEANSTTNIYLGPNLTHSQININGTLSTTAKPTIFVEKQTQTQYVGAQVFTDVITVIGNNTTAASDFNLQSFYPEVELIPNGSNYNLLVDFSSLQPSNFPGNAGVVANNLASLGLQMPLDLQDDYDVILRLSYDGQREAFLELCPQFKLIQYSLEKLLFSGENEFARKLFDFKKGVTPFFNLGFDQYAQNSINPKVLGYNKYHINSWIQNVGLTYSSGKGTIGFSVGAIESKFIFPTYPASSRYKTLTGNIGFSGKKDHFEAGIDAFGSYTGIRTQRKIPLFFKTAKSSHSAWNAAGSFEFAYNKPWNHFALRPYEKIGYIYGKEGRYTEKGANELDLAINQETLSLLRNTLGAKFTYATSNIKTFIDLAWVYEHIYSDIRYKGQFVNTPTYMDFYATPQRSNFAKGAMGFSYTKDDAGIDLIYSALISKRFLEQTANINFFKKF